jgi:hypothetical protein
MQYNKKKCLKYIDYIENYIEWSSMDITIVNELINELDGLYQLIKNNKDV